MPKVTKLSEKQKVQRADRIQKDAYSFGIKLATENLNNNRKKTMSRVSRAIRLLTNEVSMASDYAEIKILSECLRMLIGFEQDKFEKIIATAEKNTKSRPTVTHITIERNPPYIVMVQGDAGARNGAYGYSELFDDLAQARQYVLAESAKVIKENKKNVVRTVENL